jgi:hypothetical protein
MYALICSFSHPLIISEVNLIICFWVSLLSPIHFLSEYLRKVRLCLYSLSRRSSSLIVKQDKKKSTTLSYHCFRSKTYICTNFVCRSYYTTNHQFIFKMSWKVCMINHWFCYFEINFFSQLSKWNDVR